MRNKRSLFCSLWGFLIIIVFSNISIASNSILNAENLEEYLPEEINGQKRGNITRRKTDSGRKIVKTSYLILTPEFRITSSLVVAPVVFSIKEHMKILETSYRKEFQPIQKLGEKIQKQLINGKLFIQAEAAFRITDSIFGQEQSTFLFLHLHQVGNEMIIIHARSPIDEWKTTPAKIRSLMQKIVSPIN